MTPQPTIRQLATVVLAAVRALNARGITASLDLLGESVHNEAEARETAAINAVMPYSHAYNAALSPAE